MRRRPTFLVFCAFFLLSAGCPRAPETTDASRDASHPREGGGDASGNWDAFVDADALDDDVATMDASPTDARDARTQTDADAGRPCTCPPLPTTCTLPTAGVPSFTPADDSLLRQLFAGLACANSSVRGAIYENDMACVVDAIAARLDANPSLVVELVIDDEACPRVGGALACPLARLEGRPRVTIVADDRSALMHHKFFVFDDARVWVSSANLTQRSLCQDENNAIIVDEAPVVGAYLTEFRRMFVDRQFGPLPADMPVSGTSYSVYFSPRTPVTSPAPWFNDMIAALNAASATVEFEIAAFTRTELSDALIAAHRRGLRVRGVVSPAYSTDPPAMALRSAGVPLRVGEVHSKVMIIDGNLVITGSPNWSANAWSNNEDSLWVRDGRVASTYQTEFERLFAASRAP